MDWDKILTHWPFGAVAFVLSIVGTVMSGRVFTRERAYDASVRKIVQTFWYWMRETLPLHPIATGFVLGFFWIDPLAYGWGRIQSGWYFGAAGGASLFLWVVVKAYAKANGIMLELPGASVRPAKDAPPPPTTR